MRASLLLSALFLSLLLIPQDLVGQWLERSESARTEFTISEHSISFPQADPGFTEAPSWRSRILTGAGGALAGAFLGYFASEVAVGDWDARSGAEEPSRSVWAAVGGSIGLAVGFKFPLSGDPYSSGWPLGPRSGNFAIVAEEIQDASLTNAYEAVSFLRPQWLVGRGRDTFTEFGTDNIRVYLNSMELGGVESLREVEAQIIRAIRFYDALRATSLFGAGHVHGVIQVVTTGQ